MTVSEIQARVIEIVFKNENRCENNRLAFAFIKSLSKEEQDAYIEAGIKVLEQYAENPEEQRKHLMELGKE